MRKLLMVAALLAGCGTPPDPNVARAADVEVGVRAIDRGIGLSTGFVDSGVVDTAAPPDVIASSIYQRTQTQSGGCIKGSRTGAEIDLDFGTGCTVESAGLVYAGPLKAVVTPDPQKGVDITLTLSGTIDGAKIAGTFTVITPDGNLFSYQADLTFGATHVVAPNIQGGAASKAATFDATGTLEGPSSAKIPGGWQLDIMGVAEGFTGCYPSDGTATITDVSGGDNIVFGFSSSTPTNGVATVSAPASMGMVALPARMGCPPKQ